MRARSLPLLVSALVLGSSVLVSSGCWNREATWEAVDAQRSSVVREGESEAERLYRHGRDCMDTLERDDCALDYFEQLIELGPDRRDLVGDATFRLVELYRRHDRADQSTLLLRKFWDVGMDLGSAGVVPYGAKFAPDTLSSMVMVDVARLEASRLHADLPQDAKDLMFTCDETRREQLEAEVKARREAKRAAEIEGMTAEQREDYEKREAKRDRRFGRSSDADEGKEAGLSEAEKRKREQERAKEREQDKTVFSDLCTVATALGLTDYRDFSVFLGGSNHDDAGQSVAIVEIDQLEAKLAASVEAGRLTLEPELEIEGRERATMPPIMREKLRVWTIVGHEFRGEPVQVMSFDKNELFVAPKDLVPGLLHARAHDQSRLDPKLRGLIEQVPADVAFMTIITPQATQSYMKAMGAMAKLMPNPEGLLIAAVVYDYAGLFVRMPTEDSVKAWVILSLARKLLDDEDTSDEADGEVGFMTNMDISQTTDGRALLMTNILTKAAVTQIFLGY